VILSISVSPVPVITGVNHLCQALQLPLTLCYLSIKVYMSSKNTCCSATGNSVQSLGDSKIQVPKSQPVTWLSWHPSFFEGRMRWKTESRGWCPAAWIKV
jgi:hypothetical protein